MDAQETIFEELLILEDVWTGEGRAQYPTISTFRYREALTVQAVPGQPRFFLLQRTQKQNQAGEWVESHWESGFLRVLADGTVEWLDSQNGGRVEVLRGTVRASDTGLVLDFKSTLVANDARMGTTARQIILGGETLHYTMHMSMTTVPDMTMHLDAGLVRFVDKQQLLRRLDARRAEFLTQLARIPPDAPTVPNKIGAWSVRDLLAHLIAHEQRVLAELGAARRGKRPPPLRESNDAFNAEAVAARQNQSLTEVRAAWDASFAQVLAAVQALSDADFEPFGPVCELLEDTIDGALGNNTYGHYAEHLPALAELVPGLAA